MKSPPVVNCPCCAKPAVWTSLNPWRPFCSERCKSLDLGAWAAEHYRVPATPDPSQDAD